MFTVPSTDVSTPGNSYRPYHSEPTDNCGPYCCIPLISAQWEWRPEQYKHMQHSWVLAKKDFTNKFCRLSDQQAIKRSGLNGKAWVSRGKSQATRTVIWSARVRANEPISKKVEAKVPERPLCSTNTTLTEWKLFSVTWITAFCLHRTRFGLVDTSIVIYRRNLVTNHVPWKSYRGTKTMSEKEKNWKVYHIC